MVHIPMKHPRLACPNLFSDVNILKSFAMGYGFDGIDWTIRPEDMPVDPSEEARLAQDLKSLSPLDIRYHLFFKEIELGESDPEQAACAQQILYHACSLISRLSGTVATIHVGLGRDSMADISWDNTLSGLTDLADFAGTLGIRLCLENLAWGWTSRPALYEKLLRKSGCWGTLDIGHARVCRSVRSTAYHVKDFTLPHPERILNAHVYHEETSEGHVPPTKVADLEDRLEMLQRLPNCDWWVLEIREEKGLLQTLRRVREFLESLDAGESDYNYSVNY
jgi:sugar phosphate isomerase/epimerase